MGLLFIHGCKQCGYSVDLNGGETCGEMSHTTTIVCDVCCELQDVQSVQIDGTNSEPFQAVSLSCGIDRAHTVRIWESGDPCPKCGAGVERGSLTCVWD
jgi:hypothetical protein